MNTRHHVKQRSSIVLHSVSTQAPSSDYLQSNHRWWVQYQMVAAHSYIRLFENISDVFTRQGGLCVCSGVRFDVYCSMAAPLIARAWQ